MKPPPTITELEALLNSEDGAEITIRPDGSIRLDDEVADVAWVILQALHGTLPVDQRPMSWSDVKGDQEERIRAAAVAAIECIRDRDAESGSPKP